MVNTLTNISAYQEKIPIGIDVPGADRLIMSGPIYDPNQVLALVENDGGKLNPWTKKCLRDMQYKLEIDNDGAADLVRCAINSGIYRNSEWCSGNNEYVWAACDAYVLKRYEWNKFAHKDLEVEYYVKFAIQKSGKLLLLISCHTPEDKA